MTNKLLLLTLLLLIPAGAVLGQKVMAPPPPLIYTAPAEAEIKEFIAADVGFRAKFPGNPVLEVNLNAPYANYTYKVTRKGSTSSVSVIEYKETLEPQVEELLKGFRANIENLGSKVSGNENQKTKIINDKAIQLGDFKGREFSFEYLANYYKVRVIFVRNRIYEMRSDVVNWQILSNNFKGKADDFEKETQRFFDSFELIKDEKR